MYKPDLQEIRLDRGEQMFNFTCVSYCLMMDLLVVRPKHLA